METMTKAARLEVRILETLQNKRTAVGDKNCIRLVTDFTYRGHTCLVFEPMVCCWQQPCPARTGLLVHAWARQGLKLLGRCSWCTAASLRNLPTGMQAFVLLRVTHAVNPGYVCTDVSPYWSGIAHRQAPWSAAQLQPANTLTCAGPCVCGCPGQHLHAGRTFHSQCCLAGTQPARADPQVRPQHRAQPQGRARVHLPAAEGEASFLSSAGAVLRPAS